MIADERLKPRVLIGYAVSALPLSTLAVGMFIVLPTVYAETVGLAMTQLAFIIPLTRVWDVITDPLIGWLSDRTRSRWGRRRPWVLLFWLPLSVAVYALYLPPDGIGVLYLVGWSFVFFTAGTALFMPYTVWGAELSGDYHERSRVFAYRHLFAALGTLLAAGLAWLARDTETDIIGAEALALIAWVGLAILPITLIALFTQVREPPLPKRLPPRPSWKISLRVMIQNRPFRRILITYFLNGIANAFPATLFFFFVRHVIGRPADTGLLLAVYFVAAIIGTPIWIKLARRHGKHQTWCIGMVIAALAFVFVPALGSGDIGWFLIIIAVAGLTLGADLAMPGAMLADVVDEDTVATGQRRAGIYYALWAMVAKLALALGVGVTFPILGAVGFDPQISTNGATALWTLALLFGPLPMVFKLIAAAIVWRYPLTADRQAELRAAIAAADRPSEG